MCIGRRKPDRRTFIIIHFIIAFPVGERDRQLPESEQVNIITREETGDGNNWLFMNHQPFCGIDLFAMKQDMSDHIYMEEKK